MGRYDGRVAIITGSARGIGAGIAKRFADEGAAVAVLDLDEDAAAATAAGLGATQAIGVGCNVSDAASAEAAVARVVEELGGLHVLVNNAGITRDNLLFKMSEQDWDSVMGVHLKGAFLMSREAQKTFVAQKYGKILNTSSTSANDKPPARFSKSALTGTRVPLNTTAPDMTSGSEFKTSLMFMPRTPIGFTPSDPDSEFPSGRTAA